MEKGRWKKAERERQKGRGRWGEAEGERLSESG